MAEYLSKALFDEYGLILCQQQRQNNMCKPSIGELGVFSDLDIISSFNRVNNSWLTATNCQKMCTRQVLFSLLGCSYHEKLNYDRFVVKFIDF